MKYNFTNVIVKDIDGKELNGLNVHKILANAIYQYTSDLDLLEKAILMNKGEEIELDKTEIETVKSIINNEKTGFFAFVRKSFLDYIDSVK